MLTRLTLSIVNELRLWPGAASKALADFARDLRHYGDHLLCCSNRSLQALEALVDRIGVVVRKLVAYLAQNVSVVGTGQPAKLFQPSKSVKHRHRSDIFTQGSQNGRHQPHPHVVL